MSTSQPREVQQLAMNFVIMHAVHTALAEEVQEFLQPGGGHLFMLGGRGVMLDEEQLHWRGLIEDKLATGVYRMIHRPCLCGAAQDELIAVRDMFGFHFRTVICRHCGLVRADPYFDDASLQQFYALDFDHLYRCEAKDNPQDFFRMMVERRHPGVFAVLARHVPSLPGKTVYEIGCGGGWCLWPFHQAGCRVWGADYDEALVAYGRSLGMELEHGGAELLAGREPADIIILSHVLEHVPDPLGFLGRIRPALRENGVLLVEVPTLESVAGGESDGNLFRYFQIAHVFDFSGNTLCYTLERAGFACQRLKPGRVLAGIAPRVRARDEIYEGEYEQTLQTLRKTDADYLKKYRSGARVNPVFVRRTPARQGGGRSYAANAD